MANQTADVLIVGGGIIGCAVAYDLAAAGLEVSVLERDTVGSATSYGAGGLLAPQIEFAHGGPGLTFGMRSIDLYREWNDAITDRIGFGLDLDLSGVIRVTQEESNQNEFEDLVARQTGMGHLIRMLDAPSLHDWAPRLSPRATYGIWVPGGQLDAYRATRVLAQAAASHGARIHTGITATQLEDGAVITSSGRFEARYVIVATGAWIPHLLDLPLRPVKGQRLLVELPQWLTRVPIFGESVYVTPKAGGRYFLGATEEPDGGFDRRPTLAGMTEVGLEAQLLFPALAKAELIEKWAGLRPTLPDGLPVIAAVPPYDRVLVAGGHYRHGFLLAPVTARMLRDWILQGTPLPQEFSWARFDHAAHTETKDPGEPATDPATNVVAVFDKDMLQVTTVISADPAVVYRAFCDPDHYARLMPDIHRVDVLEEAESYRVVRWTARYFGQTIVWTERQVWDGIEHLESHLVTSDFFQRYRYEGRVTRHPAGSKVTIDVEMISRRRGLVLAAARRILKQNLQAFLRALARELEETSVPRES